MFETASSVTLKLRYPAWAVGERAEVSINGTRQQLEVGPGAYITLRRDWKKGDSVNLKLPMQTRLEQLPDGSDFFAILYGPIVLSAKTPPMENETLVFYADDSRMGHIASGQLCPLEDSPMLVEGSSSVLSQIKRMEGDSLRFRAPGAIEPAAW